MLTVLTSDEFSDWFAQLGDEAAEDVATAIDIVEELGPARAAPGSRESLLWYEHPSARPHRDRLDALAWHMEAWGSYYDYARQVLTKLESPRFLSRLSRLGEREAAQVLEGVKAIRAMDPRIRWTLKSVGAPVRPGVGPEHAQAELRRRYFEVLEAAGFKVEDQPAHSLALRELSRRESDRPFRLLYGVHAERETAIFLVGEWLTRSFYGDSVRRAERMWQAFLAGELRTEHARLR
jgi:hypothetical protein